MTVVTEAWIAVNVRLAKWELEIIARDTQHNVTQTEIGKIGDSDIVS